MGKISQVSSKYIVHASIEIEGVVDRPDVIGAIFGQTEGLLGSDLELRELQRSGRIGRIEVNVNTKTGKTQGVIIIPSSLDKAETSIIAAALEIIERIGPCNAKIRVQKIEDVRISKRNYVLERAKELLRNMMDAVLPDSQELADEVSHSVRVMEIVEYGADRLPAGPMIDESEDVIIVEGRADVLNLLKHGFKNAIAMNGTSCPQTIKDLTHKKDVTVFVDGDRGGDLILKELLGVAEIDFVTKAPDGKEVEEITKKEIHKALRSRITGEQARHELSDQPNVLRKKMFERNDRNIDRRPQPGPDTRQRPIRRQLPQLSPDERNKFKEMLESLVGTRGAYLLDEKLNILGKVPMSELATTISSLNRGVYAVLFDGSLDKELVQIAEKSGVKHIVAMDSKVNPREAAINILVADQI